MAVAAFGEQVQVKVANLRQEGVRVTREVFALMFVAPQQAVVLRQVAAVTAPFEVVAVRQAAHDPFAFDNAHFTSAGNESAHDHAVAVRMAAENGERVVMVGVGDALQFAAERVLLHFLVLGGSMVAGEAGSDGAGMTG